MAVLSSAAQGWQVRSVGSEHVEFVRLSFQIRLIRDQSTFTWAIELEGLCVARPPPCWLAAIVPVVEQFAYSMLTAAFS